MSPPSWRRRSGARRTGWTWLSRSPPGLGARAEALGKAVGASRDDGAPMGAATPTHASSTAACAKRTERRRPAPARGREPTTAATHTGPSLAASVAEAVRMAFRVGTGDPTRPPRRPSAARCHCFHRRSVVRPPARAAPSPTAQRGCTAPPRSGCARPRRLVRHGCDARTAPTRRSTTACVNGARDGSPPCSEQGLHGERRPVLRDEKVHPLEVPKEVGGDGFIGADRVFGAPGFRRRSGVRTSRRTSVQRGAVLELWCPGGRAGECGADRSERVALTAMPGEPGGSTHWPASPSEDSAALRAIRGASTEESLAVESSEEGSSSASTTSASGSWAWRAPSTSAAGASASRTFPRRRRRSRRSR